MNAIEKHNPTNSLDDLQRMAKMLAASGYFDLKGGMDVQVAQVATKIMAGRELGFGPFASVNGIHIISGKPSVGANLMAAAVKGSSRYDYRVREMSNDKCALEFFEREGDKKVSIGLSEFTKDDAAKAGTQNMNKFARNMLFARALSNGVRWYCPDVFAGNAVYVPEELGAEVDGDGNVIEVTGRRVEQTTGEIMDAAAQPSTDNPFDGDGDGENVARPPATAEQIMHVDEIGLEYYQEKWGAVEREKWVKWATTGEVSDINELLSEEAEKIVTAIAKRIEKKVAW